MAVLCKPEIVVPSHTITKDETIEICKLFHGSNKNISKILGMIKNTSIEKRHITRPIGETLVHNGVENRHKIYAEEAKHLALKAVSGALNNASINPKDIDLIIATSCTGFLFPSLTAYLINELGMNSNTIQLPIAQLGCVAGSSAINRASDYCKAYPDKNVLILSVELCSLLYQPTDNDFGVLVSNALFGDAASAAVMTTKATAGLKIIQNDSYLYPNSEHYISYDIKETGFHFKLNKAVPKTMEVISPVLDNFIRSCGHSAGNLDFYAIHAGGPRILNDLVKFLNLSEEEIQYSRRTLSNYGNIASVFVFDAIRRLFDERSLSDNEIGLIAGFGPGLTAEFSLAQSVEG